MRHQWKQMHLTAAQGAENPWALFGEVPVREDRSYDGPDIVAWSEDPDDDQCGHLGPLCEVCGYGFCHSCEVDLWVQVASGTETLECPAEPKPLRGDEWQDDLMLDDPVYVLAAIVRDGVPGDWRAGLDSSLGGSTTADVHAGGRRYRLVIERVDKAADALRHDHAPMGQDCPACEEYATEELDAAVELLEERGWRIVRLEECGAVHRDDKWQPRYVVVEEA